MSVTIVPSHDVLGPIFSNVYSGINSLNFGALRLSKGSFPINPSVSIAANDSTWLDNSTTISFSQANFSAISNGRCDLVAPISIPIRSSQVAQVPTFIRLQTSAAYTTGFFDISVDSAPGPSNAIINSTSISTGNTILITDLRFILKLSSGIKVTPVILNSILYRLIGRTYMLGYDTGILMFGYPKVTNNQGTDINAVLAIEAWDGVVPSNSEDTPTGTLLWKRTIPTTETSIFTCTNSIVHSTRAHSATALATGTPTFIRIVKNAITSSPYVYPKLTMQLEAGRHINFYTPTMTVGVSNTLDMFSVHMLPV